MGELMHAGIPWETARGLTRQEALHLVEGLHRARKREADAMKRAADLAGGG